MTPMKNKLLKYLPKIFAYLYLVIGYSYIILYISYNIRIMDKFEGWFFMLLKALCYFFVYAAINHILIRRIIESKKLLIIIEALLFITMLTLVISDVMYDLHIYEKITMPFIEY
jgi:hypothetical protein